MITICSECGGRDIYQNVMASINKPIEPKLNDLWMGDGVYWCEDCEEECTIEEVEEKEIFRG